MSKGANVIRSLSKGISSRTLQVTVIPTPVKFQERRAVLHALQKFAKVEVFRKLEDHVSSFVLVTSEDQLAKALTRQSPLEYQLVVEQPSDGVRGFLTRTPSTDPIIQNKELGATQVAPQPEAHDGNTKHFTVHIFPMPEYLHASAIRASPLHGQWPEPRLKTAMSIVLKESFGANDLSAEGLSDWENAGQSANATKSKEVEDLLFGNKAMDPRKRALKERLLRGERKRNMPVVINGLLHLQADKSARQGQGGSSQPGT